jgi:uncharacterized protein DUF4332
MPYDMDLSKISLEAYRQHLSSREMMPSRRILHEETDARFDALAAAGIGDIDALRKAIANPKRIGEMASKSGIPAQYLNILRREIGSLVPKRIKLSAFPGVDEGAIEKLSEIGVRNSKDFFDEMTQERAGQMGIGAEAYRDIRALCDIARISGMGGIAARILVDAGYRSVEDVQSAEAKTMHTATCTVNDEKAYYGGVLSVKDMQYCIDYATMIKGFTQE